MTEPAAAASAALAAAVIGGALCFLGFLGFGCWPLSLLCFVPLWWAIEASRARGLPFAALLGFVFGLTAYIGGFHWMWRLVDAFLGGDVLLGALLFLSDASWFALRFALWAGAFALLRRRGCPAAVAGVAGLVAIEWLHPMLFPVYLGHALARRPSVAQISDLGGPLLMTAFLALMNAAAFDGWQWLRRRRGLPLWTWTAAALAAALTLQYARVRTRQIDAAVAAAPSIEVGIVQGNLGLFEKGSRAVLDHRRYLEQTRELLAAGPVDLVVWPETIYTRGLLRPLPLSGRLVREEIEVPLLFGGASVRGDSGHRLKYNSALLVGADGVIRDVYDKNLLIPFTEYVPLAELGGAWLERFAGASEFAAAGDVPALRFGTWRISTPICYEAVRPAFVRRMVLEADPSLIATLANDSWFGDSQEAELHLAMAEMRAIEHRRFLVRATNSGISAIVDPVGRELVRSGLLTRENLRARVHALDTPTLYTAFGDWPGWVAVAALALWALSSRGRACRACAPDRAG